MPVRQVKNAVNRSLLGDSTWSAFVSASAFGAIISMFIATGTGYFNQGPAPDMSVPVPAEPVAVAAPVISEAPQLHKDQILSDYGQRMSEAFKVPSGIRDRVGFWFDIYTKYGYHQRVIHHTRYPWIVYRVVDVAQILNAEAPKARWLREQRANNYVEAEVRSVREILWKLSKKKSFTNLTADEKQIFDLISQIPGKPELAARKALTEMRTQMGQRDFFMQGIELSNRYLPRMEQIFRDHKLPVELTRLPLVESSFNKHATSKAGASGIWQFMGNTGKKYMRVTDTIDERRSPFKSTEAAARLLKENHLILYKSWPLAITAYNHGPSGVRRAVKKFGTVDISKLANEYQTRNFDFASQNYYSEFLGALYAERYAEQIWSDLNREQALNLVWFQLPRNTKPSQILTVLGMTTEDFLFYNPDIRAAVLRNAKLPKGFKITLPAHLTSELERELAQLDLKSSKKVI